MKKLFATLCLCLLIIQNIHAFVLPHIKEQTLLSIGIKVWANESGNSIAGLTSWNKGEKFASMGIGHFLWSPSYGTNDKSQSFAVLIHYQENQGITPPSWLQGNRVPPCPWKTRIAFLRAQNSPRMRELRQYLANTIASQSKFMLYRLQQSIQHMLQTANNHDRHYLENNLQYLSSTPLGLYVLIDYVNFKGLGLKNYRQTHYGWGLMSVLLNMRNAKGTLNTLQAFTWSADKLLTDRANRSINPYDRKWLIGWRSRLQTYLASP